MVGRAGGRGRDGDEKEMRVEEGGLRSAGGWGGLRGEGACLRGAVRCSAVR